MIIHLKDRDLLLVASYEARAADTEASREQDLAAILRTLEAIVRKARQVIENGRLEVLIYVDLNRYYML